MTRIGVVSDSHMMPETWLQRAADQLKARKVSRVVHLGDGLADWDRLQALLDLPMTIVAGNCDGVQDVAQESMITVEGAKILLCHGHRLAVKHGLIRLKLRAEELACRAALYGHTHVQAAEWDGGLLLLNPGALREGRFAVLSVDDGALGYEFG